MALWINNHSTPGAMNKRDLSEADIKAKFITPAVFDYLSWWFKTIDLSTVGNDSVIPQVNNKDILPLLFPLPTFTEQVLIAEKINFLVEKASSLEKEIATSEANAQMLMQAVLKEAFEVKEEKIEQAELMT